jgi:hypothetical protein
MGAPKGNKNAAGKRSGIRKNYGRKTKRHKEITAAKKQSENRLFAARMKNILNPTWR